MKGMLDSPPLSPLWEAAAFTMGEGIFRIVRITGGQAQRKERGQKEADCSIQRALPPNGKSMTPLR
jgi:hypothetical protein